MSEVSAEARQAIQLARQALREGDKHLARRLAQQAARLAPEWEDPWLWLAASAAPRASLGYLRKALEINPASQRARQGIHWAIERERKQSAAAIPFPSTARSGPLQIPPPGAVRTGVNQPARIQAVQSTLRNLISQPGLFFLLVLCLSILFWFTYPHLSHTNPFGFLSVEARGEIAMVLPAWLAPTIVPSATPTHTPTPTPTHTPTATATATATATPTDTATPTSTDTPVPTDTPIPPTPQPPPRNRDIDYLPAQVGAGDRWIDVDLSQQTVYAYEGYKQVNQFLVSTGTWQHPTVTGTFSIYVMYRYADMAGPGYYLPDVPYVMYFYSGYGLHGTYWHDNFGTPMSHGCVNLRTPDAGWVFDWASVGTVVNVHD